MFHAKHAAQGGLEGVWTGSKQGLGRARSPLARASGGLLLAALAACSSPEDIARETGVPPAAASAPAPAPAPASTAAAPAAVTFTDNAGTDDAARTFSYVWPAEVSAVPELVGRFTEERGRLLAEQKAEWEEAKREFAGEDCTACVNRSFEKTWAVVADLPRFLSLSASFYAYTGGAHGNGAYDALVWDREAGKAIDPKAMFASPRALQDALGGPWCKALKAERSKRMEPEFTDDGFFACPAIADLTVLAGSSDRKAFNRIGLIAAPYVAGSYAEGTYEVTLPVTQRVLAALKPEYRSAFAAAK